MSKYVSRGLALVLFTGGLTLLGAGIANAADTTGDDGLLSGTQVVAPINAPIEAAGNAVSILGDALSGGAAAPAPAPAPAAAPAASPVTTSGTESVLGGTQAVVDVVAPLAVQGNAISVAGDSAATAAPVASAPVSQPAAPAAAASTSGSDGVAGGTQVLPTVIVPVNLGGNAISVLGDSSSEGASVPAASTPAGNGAATTSGSDGVAGGTQVLPTAIVPVNLGGNAISVLGDSSSEGASAPAATTPAANGGATTSGSDGIAGGSQVLPTAVVPVNLSGNAISVLGDSSSEGASAPAATTPSGSVGSTGGATTTGSDSVAGGTQIAPDAALPVSIGGNAISILGDAASTGSSTPATQEGTNGGVTTTGNDGILGGTQILPSIALPISIGDNAISVLGDARVVPADGTSGTDGGPVDPTDPVVPTDPTGPATPTDPTGDNGATDGAVVLAAGVSTTAMATTAAFNAMASATAGLSAQALASTGAEIAPLVGLIALLLAAGIALVVIGRRRTV